MIRAILCMLAVLVPAGGFAAEKAKKKPGKPLVLAFYHPCHGTPWGPSKEWKGWDSRVFPGKYDPSKMSGERREIASGDYPLIGPYDTSDPEIVRWHMKLARAAGIDGLIVSWWKSPKPDKLYDWQASLFEKVILPSAESEGMKVCVLDEYAHYAEDFDALVSRASDHLPGFAAHPAYLRVNDQPVWFVYQVGDDWLTPPKALEYCRAVEKKVGPVYWIFDRMRAVPTDEPGFPDGMRLKAEDLWLAIPEIDCVGSRGLYGHVRATGYEEQRLLFEDYTQSVRASGKAVMLPISPGRSNFAASDEPIIVSRRDGAQYRDSIRAAKAAGPDIIAVRSFNEWQEMTGIEPSTTYRDPFMYLKITATIRGAKWKTPAFPSLRSLDPAAVSRVGTGIVIYE